MPRTDREKIDSAALLGLARRMSRSDVRKLFLRFCHEVIRFSEEIEVETAPFELTMQGPHGFAVVVSPFRELFLVSVGEGRSFDIRVSSVDSFASALDLTLHSYLMAQSKVHSAA